MKFILNYILITQLIEISLKIFLSKKLFLNDETHYFYSLSQKILTGEVLNRRYSSEVVTIWYFPLDTNVKILLCFLH